MGRSTGRRNENYAVRPQDLPLLPLSFVFDRLYVLRNQLVHGGATWNSAVNRDQVRDGASILGFLMPVFVDVMMDNPHEDWGRPFYPSWNRTAPGVGPWGPLQ